jgi:hypothetical protein
MANNNYKDKDREMKEEITKILLSNWYECKFISSINNPDWFSNIIEYIEI